MTKLNKIIFTFLLLFLKINSQIPSNKVINTCGKLGYDPPSGPEECKEKGEYCCFLHIQNTKTTTEELKFCVSSPSDIDIDDVKSEIQSYTGYKILQLSCNKGQIIKDSITVLLVLFFIFF